MGLAASHLKTLERARRALDDGSDLPLELRDTIRSSWLRSRMAAAPVDRIAVPYRETDRTSERLVRAAEPILSRFADQLADTNVSIVLADRNARVVGRWAGDRGALRGLAQLSIDEGFVLAEELAGTNGVGTVLEELAPVTIVGAEHYSEPLRRLVCVGVPIRHPLTRRIEGVLDLACPTHEATGLLVPTALDLSAQIERELSAGASARERAVFDKFTARCRETSAAIVGLSEHYMVTNAAAADLLESRDQRVLWEQASRSGPAVAELVLSSGATVSARFTQIEVGSWRAGTLIEFRPAPRPAVGPGHDRPRARNSPGLAAQVEAQLLGLIQHPPARLRIIGEAGTGKLAAARRIHRLLHPDDPLTVHPAGLAQVHGARQWLTELEQRLDEPRGTIVVKNISALDDAVAQALADLLDTPAAPQLLIIGTHLADPGRARTALESRFGDNLLRLPPVRHRREDIPDLVYEILRGSGFSARVGHRAMAALTNFSWPGNFPELQRAVREAARAAGSGSIGVEHLDDEVRGSVSGRHQLSRLEALERETIVEVLRAHRGNRAKAAEELGMSRSTLYRRLRLFGLEANRSILLTGGSELADPGRGRVCQNGTVLRGPAA